MYFVLPYACSQVTNIYHIYWNDIWSIKSVQAGKGEKNDGEKEKDAMD